MLSEALTKQLKVVSMMMKKLMRTIDIFSVCLKISNRSNKFFLSLLSNTYVDPLSTPIHNSTAHRYLPWKFFHSSTYCNSPLIYLQTFSNPPIQASPGKKTKTTQALKSPCPFGCVGYLALAELLISFYIYNAI